MRLGEVDHDVQCELLASACCEPLGGQGALSDPVGEDAEAIDESIQPLAASKGPGDRRQIVEVKDGVVSVESPSVRQVGSCPPEPVGHAGRHGRNDA